MEIAHFELSRVSLIRNSKVQKFDVRIIGIAKAILAGLAVFALRVLIERLKIPVSRVHLRRSP